MFRCDACVYMLGVYSPPKHGVRITTVKVKTQRTASNRMKPTGIDHMDSVTRFIHNTEAMDTNIRYAALRSLVSESMPNANAVRGEARILACITKAN
jgi:hypothetical protein